MRIPANSGDRNSHPFPSVIMRGDFNPSPCKEIFNKVFVIYIFSKRKIKPHASTFYILCLSFCSISHMSFESYLQKNAEDDPCTDISQLPLGSSWYLKSKRRRNITPTREEVIPDSHAELCSTLRKLTRTSSKQPSNDRVLTKGIFLIFI